MAYEETVFQGEAGRELTFKVEEDISSATDMVLIYFDPEGRRIEKRFGDGVTVGAADTFHKKLGELEAGFYFTYKIEADLLVIAGRGELYYAYEEGGDNVPEYVGLLNVKPMGAKKFTNPTNRAIKFSRTPVLTIGDVFVVQGQLMAGNPSQPIDVSEATAIKVAVIDKRSKSKLTADQAVGQLNNDWNHGIILPSIPDTETVTIDPDLSVADLEIEVVLDGKDFTWFHPVYLQQGQIT